MNTLFPCNVHRLRHESRERRSRPEARDHVYVERQNLTMRMYMRRFTRLTNGFSKKVENHRIRLRCTICIITFAVSINRCVTPAMEAGLTDHVWGLEELCALLPKPVVKASSIEKNLLAKALGIRNAV